MELKDKLIKIEESNVRSCPLCSFTREGYNCICVQESIDKKDKKLEEDNIFMHSKVIPKIRNHLSLLNKTNVVKFEIDDNYKVSVNVICEYCKKEMINGESGFYCMCDIEKIMRDTIENSDFKESKRCSNIKKFVSYRNAMKDIEFCKKQTS